MFKLVLEKVEEPEIKLPTSVGSYKKQEKSRKASTSALLTMPNLSFCRSKQTGKFLEMRLPDHLICLLRISMQYKKQQLEPDMEHILVAICARSMSRLYTVLLLM